MRSSSVRATLFQVTDDVSEPEDPIDDVVQCFQDYEDADSITTLHNDYFTCDCCDVADQVPPRFEDELVV